MVAPTPSWNLVRIYGTWRGQDGALLAGKFKVTIPARITNSTDDAIIPAGVYASGDLQTTVTGSPSLDVLVPATDDPDNDQTGWKVNIEVTFVSAAGEKYVIDVPVADRPVADGGTGVGVNLRTIAMSAQIPQQVALYKVGVPGGLAQLDENGDVVDADGNPVTGGGGGAELTSYETQVETLSDYPATFPPEIGTTSTTAKAGDYQPTWAQVTGKPAIPDSPDDIGAATSAQGAKADTAVQPGDLSAVATSGSAADLTGTLPTSVLPPLAINETFVVANQTAMLALTAQRGDMAIRSDNGRTYVLATDSPSTLADWKEVQAAGQVTAVAGKTGNVTLDAGDVSGALSTDYNLRPVIYYDGTTWPARTLPSGYAGAVDWDSALHPSAPEPTGSVDGDRWIRKAAS